MLHLVYIKTKGETMSKKNITSLIVTAPVTNTTTETGIIRSPKDSRSEESNTSMNISEKVDYGNLKTGNIDETLEKSQLEAEIEQLRKEIQPLLEHLAQNPITANEALAETAIQQQINNHPTFRQRLINAWKAGGLETLKAIFNHPAFSIPVETVKGFLEG